MAVKAFPFRTLAFVTFAVFDVGQVHFGLIARQKASWRGADDQAAAVKQDETSGFGAPSHFPDCGDNDLGAASGVLSPG